MATPNFEIKIDTKPFIDALLRATADANTALRGFGISAEMAGRNMREALSSMYIDYDCLIKKPYKPTTIFNTVRKVRFR